jgi:hypothetical protein
MKGTPTPERFATGTCFICKKKCDEEAYCHFECSVAYSEEKNRRIKEAIEKEKNA